MLLYGDVLIIPTYAGDVSRHIMIRCKFSRIIKLMVRKTALSTKFRQRANAGCLAGCLVSWGVERRMLIGSNVSQSLKVRRFGEDRVAHISPGIVLCQIQYLRSHYLLLFHHSDSSLLYFPIAPPPPFTSSFALLPFSKPT